MEFGGEEACTCRVHRIVFGRPFSPSSMCDTEMKLSLSGLEASALPSESFCGPLPCLFYLFDVGHRICKAVIVAGFGLLI